MNRYISLHILSVKYSIMFVHHWYDLSGPGGLRRPGRGTAEGLRGHNASFFTPPDPITPFLALEMKEGSVIGRGGKWK